MSQSADERFREILNQGGKLVVSREWLSGMTRSDDVSLTYGGVPIEASDAVPPGEIVAVEPIDPPWERYQLTALSRLFDRPLFEIPEAPYRPLPVTALWDSVPLTFRPMSFAVILPPTYEETDRQYRAIARAISRLLRRGVVMSHKRPARRANRALLRSLTR